MEIVPIFYAVTVNRNVFTNAVDIKFKPDFDRTSVIGRSARKTLSDPLIGFRRLNTLGSRVHIMRQASE